MGFGQGILADPRRGPIVAPSRSTGERLRLVEFGPIAGGPQPLVSIEVPENTPPFTRPGIADELGHNRPELLVTTDTRGRLLRSLVSDARDLLVETLFEIANVREDGSRRWNQSVVEMFWDNTPAPLVTEAGVVVPTGTKTIHLGPTDTTRRFLQELYATRRLELGWDGTLESLDGDGFIAISLQEGPHKHLLLAGGSEYGTYFAVAWFLREKARARWLFPGPDGTVLPRTGTLSIDEVVNQIEEPHYRSRSLGALVYRSAYSAREVNATRNWVLRNLLRPTEERALLFYLRPPARTPPVERVEFKSCRNLTDDRRLLLQTEERCPGTHNLSHFFSPHKTSMDYTRGAAAPDGMGLRGQVSPEIYPSPGPYGIGNPLPVVGRRPEVRVNYRGTHPDPVPCVPNPLCECPQEDFSTGTEPTMLQEVIAVGSLNPDIPQRFSNVVRGENLPRYILCTRTRTHLRDHEPFQAWMPCLYGPHDTSLGAPPMRAWPPGQIGRFRETVAADLATQLARLWVLAPGQQAMARPELCVSLAVDDTVYWCRCTSCTLSNGLGEFYGLETDTSPLLYRGCVLVTHVNHFRAGNDGNPFVADEAALQERARTAHQHARVASAALQGITADGIDLGRLAVETGLDNVADDASNNERLKRLHRLALQGVMIDPARPSRYTRRVIDLMNQTAIALEPSDYGGSSPVTRLPRPALKDTLLTFHAYYEHAAPPVFEQNPNDLSVRRRFYPDLLAERFPDPASMVLHPVCTPVVSALRDSWEYSKEPWARSEEGESFYKLRKAPAQFNLERWSRIARQTGLYEWFYGGGFVAPVLYTKRLRNALQGGYYDARARTFLGECLPHMGLDGIKYYEAAQVLWNVDVDLNRTRTDYCTALFGAVPEANRWMQLFFRDLEFLWAARSPEEQVTQPGNFDSYRGRGLIGAAGWITQLDYLLRDPNSPTRSIPALTDDRSPFKQLWAHLTGAFLASRSQNNEAVKRRVQFFRRAFGLVRELVQVWHPIAIALDVLESQIRTTWGEGEAAIFRSHYEPLVWVGSRRLDRRFGEIQSRIAEALTGAMGQLGVNVTVPRQFRERVRLSVHRYLAMTDVHGTSGELGELGLGLGVYNEATREFTPSGQDPNGNPLFLPNQDDRTSWRQAFSLPLIIAYVNWWLNPRIRADDRLTPEERSMLETAADASPTPWSLVPGRVVDGGLGGGMFWSMKRILAALMAVAGRRSLDIFNLLVNG